MITLDSLCLLIGRKLRLARLRKGRHYADLPAVEIRTGRHGRVLESAGAWGTTPLGALQAVARKLQGRKIVEYPNESYRQEWPLPKEIRVDSHYYQKARRKK